jgi:hypothetical protein
VRCFAGFAKVALEPGRSATVDVDLSPAAFRRWASGWLPVDGPHTVVLGRSAASIEATLTVGQTDGHE